VLVENHECRLAIPPREVPKKLVARSRHLFGTSPHLALGHESCPIGVLDPNVGLPLSAEGLAGCPSFIVPIQVREDDVPKSLFVVN